MSADESYACDENGNRTKRTQTSTGIYHVYEWDHRNRLASVTVRNADHTIVKKTHYYYDAFDRRIAEDVDNAGDGSIERVMTWVYDSEGKRDSNGHPIDDVVLVFDGAGNLLRRFVHSF